MSSTHFPLQRRECVAHLSSQGSVSGWQVFPHSQWSLSSAKYGSEQVELQFMTCFCGHLPLHGTEVFWNFPSQSHSADETTPSTISFEKLPYSNVYNRLSRFPLFLGLVSPETRFAANAIKMKLIVAPIFLSTWKDFFIKFFCSNKSIYILGQLVFPPLIISIAFSLLPAFLLLAIQLHFQANWLLFLLLHPLIELEVVSTL